MIFVFFAIFIFSTRLDLLKRHFSQNQLHSSAGVILITPIIFPDSPIQNFTQLAVQHQYMHL